MYENRQEMFVSVRFKILRFCGFGGMGNGEENCGGDGDDDDDHTGVIVNGMI